MYNYINLLCKLLFLLKCSYHFIFSSTALVKTSKAMLNNSDDKKGTLGCLSSAECFHISPRSMKFAVGCDKLPL